MRGEEEEEEEEEEESDKCQITIRRRVVGYSVSCPPLVCW